MGSATAVILAAGLSRRMGRDKLLLPYRGKPLLEHCLELATCVGFHRRILVTTGERLGRIRLPDGVEAVRNPDPAAGQSGSVRLGVLAASPLDSLLFFPGDQPLLNVEIIRQLLAKDDGEHIVYPLRRDGSPASPVLFGPCFRGELLALTGDKGGRSLRDAHPEACVGVPVREPWLLRDIDTEEDYRALL